jgi:hypothetical protein
MLLCDLTGSGQDPCAAFRLEAGAVPPPAKWGKALDWTPRDDAVLLLGVFYHGLGHWEELVADARLGLQAKLGGILGPGGNAAAAGREEEQAGGDKGQIAPKGKQRNQFGAHSTFMHNLLELVVCAFELWRWLVVWQDH